MKVRQFQGALISIFVTAVSVASVTAFTGVAEAQDPNGTITNQGSGLCLQPENGSTVAGAAIVQEPCSSAAGAAQLWSIVSVKAPYVHYMNQGSGMCLDARGGAQNFTPVQQWPCNGISNEYWVYNPSFWGKKSPVTLFSGVAGSYLTKNTYCLDVPLNLTTPGVKLQIYKCNWTTAQQFY